MALCLVIMIFVIFKWPLDNWRENVSLGLTNILYCGIMVVYLFLESISKDMSQKDRYNKLGTTGMIIIALILLVNVIFALVTLLLIFIEKITKCRNKSKKNQEVAPADNSETKNIYGTRRINNLNNKRKKQEEIGEKKVQLQAESGLKKDDPFSKKFNRTKKVDDDKAGDKNLSRSEID
jgi:hypothetical protein